MKKLLPIYAAAAILAATVAQAHAQADDMDKLIQKQDSPTPAPTAAATPKPTAAPRPATAEPPSRPAATAAPRPTAAPHETVKDQLAHGNFVGTGDLAALAGKRVPANTFLTGTLKYIGGDEHGRRRFQTAEMSSFFTAAPAPALVFIRFPGHADPKMFENGYKAQWAKTAPLWVESVTSTSSGITVYATDVVP